MVRSMYSGVSGMKAHQTKMDVIGNNIANVNTYGFKSSRATFRDIYYQTMKGAAAASGSKGGINASQVGYGSALGSVDVMHTQSNLSTTGNPLDLAISGDGYFQVMDGDGNKYYTRAGLLDIDAAGNLIDVNGNFVLGTNGDPLGKQPSSQKIFFNIPSVDPAASSKVEEINGNKITISASETTNEGNVAFQLASKAMAVGKKAEAVISTNGGITVYLNSNETYGSMSDVNTAVNAAIVEANGGKAHPGGTFSITSVPDPFTTGTGTGPFKGNEVVSSTPEVKLGSISLEGANMSGFTVQNVGSGFTGKGMAKFTVTKSGTNPVEYEVTATFDGAPGSWKGKITDEQLKNGGVPLQLSNGAGDTFELNIPSTAGLDAIQTANGATATTASTETTKSNALGLGVSTKLEGGTKGGPQTVADLSSIQIGADGVVTAVHGILGELAIGRIDLVTFENPNGLVEAGNSYFTSSANSGDAKPGVTGDSSTGMLAQSSLELSNVDLSQEFADMIVTQRGFQANSRLITVSDTMLEELINLKR